MNIDQAYTTWSATYDHDRNRTRDLDAEVTRTLLDGWHGDRILEFGCGTGKNTVLFADRAREVRALDFSEGMLARAREKVTAAHVTFLQADLTQPWPCETAWAGLVIGNLVLEHIADLGPVFAEAARVLAPGGVLLMSELHPFRQNQGTQANFEQGGVVTEVAAYVHHVSDFTEAARAAGLVLDSVREWWHAEDEGKPPRLLTLRCRKP